MFITIQYPIFDSRPLSLQNNRSERPYLPDPQENDILRYIGGVINAKSAGRLPDKTIPGARKVKKYFGTWDSSRMYFDASSVLVLAGLDENNYYKKLRDTDVHTRLLFRRFQADSNFMVRYEMAWTDDMESRPAYGLGENQSLAWLTHLQKYLECTIKIRVGSRHRKEVAIAQAGSHLIYSYYWATNASKHKSFKDKDLHYQVEYLPPYLVVHTLESEATLAALTGLGFKEVKLPALSGDPIKLFFGSVEYTVSGIAHSIEAWIITSPTKAHSCPRTYRHFIDLPEPIKNLRKNLLQIPAQIYGLKKLNASLANPAIENKLQQEPVQKLVAMYLHSGFTALIKRKRNNQEQQEIINTIFRNLDDMQSPDLKSEYQKSIDWFRFLPPTPANLNMKAQLEALEFKKKVYISSTFRDLKEYRKTLIDLFEKELHNKFELCYIMEKMFDDGEHTPFVDDCIRAVKDCDVYFIILGNKVGSFLPDKSRTYTEAEYETALQTNKKIFMFRLKNMDEAQIDDKIKHEAILKKFEGKPVHEFEGLKDFENGILRVLAQF